MTFLKFYISCPQLRTLSYPFLSLVVNRLPCVEKFSKKIDIRPILKTACKIFSLCGWWFYLEFLTFIDKKEYDVNTVVNSRLPS